MPLFNLSVEFIIYQIRVQRFVNKRKSETYAVSLSRICTFCVYSVLCIYLHKAARIYSLRLMLGRCFLRTALVKMEPIYTRVVSTHARYLSKRHKHRNTIFYHVVEKKVSNIQKGFFKTKEIQYISIKKVVTPTTVFNGNWEPPLNHFNCIQPSSSTSTCILFWRR